MKPIIPHCSESHTQQMIMRWWKFACRGYGLPEFALMAFPLQGARTEHNGARMKAEGMRAGTPDMFLALPGPTGGGLWIELKTPLGKLTDSQKEFKLYLEQHYEHRVVRSFDEARTVIEHYLFPIKMRAQAQPLAQ